MMTDYEAKRLLDEVQPVYGEKTLEYWGSIERCIISYAKRCCSSEYFSWQDLEELISESIIALYKLHNKIEEENKEVTCYYITRAMKNFFVNSYNEKKRKRKRREEYSSLKKNYGEEQCFDIIAERSQQVMLNTVEDELVYSPLIDMIEDKLSKESKDVLEFILENQYITAEAYAKDRELKYTTALKRIERFREQVKYAMYIWEKENEEEVKLMGEVFECLHDFHRH
ncbi:hypothetical protein [Clostridium peptidivorans]|uniref:hypothetical protein n=1 Tax=Clostridium peptidivorans TaxID=100174 RepID=UPI000BE3E904|nr:hypothetical protein [Clostridium peptidivorans]